MPKVIWFEPDEMEHLAGYRRQLKGSWVSGFYDPNEHVIGLNLRMTYSFESNRTSRIFKCLLHEILHYLFRHSIFDKIMDDINLLIIDPCKRLERI